MMAGQKAKTPRTPEAGRDGMVGYEVPRRHGRHGGVPEPLQHCWLGAKPNGHMDVETFVDIARQFKGWRDENGQGIHELAFFQGI